MRIRSFLTFALLAALAGPSLANFEGKPPLPSSQLPTSGQSGDGSGTPTVRQQAERLYGDAYDDVARARDAVLWSKPKDAEKKYRRALERAKQAVALDTTYHEAWNLVGFASRKLGDYPASLAAYRTCLRQRFDYAPAREYYGEALLETGDLKGARDQIVWLRRLKAEDLAVQLENAIEAKAGPANAEPSAGASKSDSTGTH